METHERDDEQLISDYLAGDERALGVLIERHATTVYRFLYKRVGNAHDAEDITQDAFVKIWKNLHRYKPGQSFRAWMFAIARNAMIDRLRKRKDVVFSEFENDEGENALYESLVDSELRPDERAVRAETGREFEYALEHLAPHHRQIITLHHKDDLTLREIGQRLNRSVNTVKSQHRRALAALRAFLDAPADRNRS